jgi:hypothetical protein
MNEQQEDDPRVEPFSDTFEGWEERKKKQKELYPIWFFFHKTIPSKWRRFSYILTHEIPWWFKHRLIPQHRYHVVRTGLKPGYYDPDTLIFWACFKQFERYLKYHSEWLDDPEIYPESEDDGSENGWHHFRREAKALRQWWNVDRPSRNVDWWKSNLSDEESFKGFQMEDEWDKEDTQMLVRLAKIRKGLWW